MTKQRPVFITVVGMSLALLAGCSTQASVSAGTAADVEEPAPVEEETVEEEVTPPEDPEDVHLEGDHLVIDKKIHFAHDSDEILDDSSELLDHIATALKNHQEVAKVHVIGHTDASGGADHNKDLSERRAASVVAALRDRGVTQELDSRGAGESEHLCEEDTDECHEKNRRVEFLVEMAE